MSRAAAACLLVLLWQRTTLAEFAWDLLTLAGTLAVLSLWGWLNAPEPWIGNAEDWER